MKKILTIFLLAPFALQSETFDITCRDSDCFQQGWTMTEVDAAYRLEVLCTHFDCQKEGWTGSDTKGVHYQTLCKGGGCFREGYVSTEYRDGLFLVDDVSCRQGDCLKHGWDIATNYDEGGNASCKENDCSTHGGTAFWRGRNSETTCKNNDCYKTGWTWVIQ